MGNESGHMAISNPKDTFPKDKAKHTICLIVLDSPFPFHILVDKFKWNCYDNSLRAFIDSFTCIDF